MSIYLIRDDLLHFDYMFGYAHWNKYTGLASASCVRISDDSWFCNSHCISHSCCVLHRYGSQDIHRWKFRLIFNQLSSLWFYYISSNIVKNKFHYQVQLVISSNFVNDPSAGSPTETLLRLHLPLNDKIYTTSLLFFNLLQLKNRKSKVFTGSFNR